MDSKLPLRELQPGAPLSTRIGDSENYYLMLQAPEKLWQDYSHTKTLNESDDALCCYDDSQCQQCDFYRERLLMCLEDIRSSETHAKPKIKQIRVPRLFPQDNLQTLRDRLLSRVREVFPDSQLESQVESVEEIFKELTALKSQYEAPKHTRALSAPNTDDEHRLLELHSCKLASLEKLLKRGDENADHKLTLEIAKVKSKILQLRSEIAIKTARDNSCRANGKLEALNRNFEIETQRNRSRVKLSLSRDNSPQPLPTSCDVSREHYNLEQEKEAMRKLWTLMHKRIANSKQTLQAKRLALVQEKQKLKQERSDLQQTKKELQALKSELQRGLDQVKRHQFQENQCLQTVSQRLKALDF